MSMNNRLRRYFEKLYRYGVLIKMEIDLPDGGVFLTYIRPPDEEFIRLMHRSGLNMNDEVEYMIKNFKEYLPKNFY